MGTIDQTPRRQSNDRISWGTIFGLILIGAGILLLGFNYRLIPPLWKPIVFSWPMLLFVIGIAYLGKSKRATGILFLLIGVFFMIPRLAIIFPGSHLLHTDLTKILWPVMIVMLGIALLSSTKRKTDIKNLPHEKSDDNTTAHPQEGTIDYEYLFGGSEQVFLEPVFRGGEIKICFGGMSLDLRKTTLPEGVTTLKIDNLFGGVTLLVPSEWHLDIQPQTLVGGVTDKRFSHVSTDNNRPRLKIIARCIFAGVDIRE